VCETITDINNLISRWCFKNKIDPQSSNTSKCIINLNSGIGQGGSGGPEPWLVEPQGVTGLGAPQINANADMITTGTVQRTLRADFSQGIFGRPRDVVRDYILAHSFVQGEGSSDEI